MTKVLLTAVMSLGILYAQSVSANEINRYEEKLYVASAGQSQGNTKLRQYRRNQVQNAGCPDGNCGERDQPVLIRSQAVTDPATSLDQVENNMDIIDRDHAARAGRGR